MKILVVSNCATLAYVNNLKLVFPDADIRGARLDVAEKWLTTERKEAFADFMKEADFLVGATPTEHTFLEVGPHTQVLSIPPFLFRGLQPDVIQLFGGPPSVLGKEGVIYSRIIATAFIEGLDEQQAEACFHEDVYAATGYFNAYDQELKTVAADFDGTGINISDMIEEWKQEGPFLFLPNHGMKHVYFDIVWALLSSHGLLPAGTPEKQELASRAECIFPKPASWPVYPEIAAQLGVEGSMHWTTAITAGHETLDLHDFVSRSYENLRAFGAIKPEQVPGFDHCSAAVHAQM
ncbi:WcbI family polysaccharide biosynthesis putative acetyltransferase [Kordiimonas gwangyangensis]|uniref:WcbI family polysaccharide biosynthesis putative acetyltransferase n=1 Tax=Kordiimonas gwangyangensis TaxID=288022 RepID=UPI00037C7762|nr:WcbI family polysaccharide biosynthesis putative acetyltransferase [Kordiimonas gwangyangensis]